MTDPNGRYQVEQLVRGGWVLTDAFADYHQADDWAHDLLADRGAACGVRVLDTVRERADADPVVWAVMSW